MKRFAGCMTLFCIAAVAWAAFQIGSSRSGHEPLPSPRAAVPETRRQAESPIATPPDEMHAPAPAIVEAEPELGPTASQAATVEALTEREEHLLKLAFADLAQEFGVMADRYARPPTAFEPLPDRLSVGAVGTLGGFKVFQVTDGGAIIERRPNDDKVFVRGMDRYPNMVDGATFRDPENGYIVSSTMRYRTVLGATNTIFTLQPIEREAYIHGLSEWQFNDPIAQAGFTRKSFAA